MNRRAFLASAAIPFATPFSAAAQFSRSKPNIVVILADDLGTGDVSCYNREARTRTRAIDGLAQQGMRFTDAHSPSAVCTPTRYGLLTGRYCWRSRLKSGVLNGYSPNLIEDKRPTIASMLKQAGYRTGGFGKWHLGLGTAEKTDYSKPFSPSPLDHGFDEFYGIPASLDMPPYLFFDGNKAVEQPSESIETNGAPPRGAYWRGGPIAPNFQMKEVVPTFTAYAEEFIRDAKEDKRPYFAYIPLPAPHTPWVPQDKYEGKSQAGLYGDFVEELDDCIGKILAAIDDSGTAKNTLVILTSDNGAPWSEPDIEASGGHRANAGLRGQKADIYEAGHRVPFIVRWPQKVRELQSNPTPICLVDIFATALDVAGVKAPKDIGGEDSYTLMPALQGKVGYTAVRPHIVHHSADGLFAIRQNEWKLTLGLGSGGFTQPKKIEPKDGQPNATLYNLARDPQEKYDVYAKEPAKVAELMALLDKIKAQS